jgi:hypothetical protein
MLLEEYWHSIVLTIVNPFVMLFLLTSLTSIIEPEISLTRSEVIKRYRALKHGNSKLLQLLCMLQFSSVSKNKNGELFIV